jgi:hypothetical protein
VEPALEIANEFGLVRIAKVRTRNGERLEISSPRRDSLIRLDPLELEALTEQDPEFFARLAGHQPPDEGDPA